MDALLSFKASGAGGAVFCEEKKPYKAFTDFPDGRTAVIESNEEWVGLVNDFYQLGSVERKQVRNASSSNIFYKLMINDGRGDWI